MADHGFIVVWLDQDKDPSQAKYAVEERYPHHRLLFLNPRHFDGPRNVGVPEQLIRGYVLATQAQHIHEAYALAGIEYVDFSDLPLKPKDRDMRVMIYTKPNDNAWNDQARTLARAEFPAHSLRIRFVGDYKGPELDQVRGVICPDDAVRIIDDYRAQNIPVIPLPPMGTPVPTNEQGEPLLSKEEVDMAVVDATLRLDVSDFLSVVEAQENPRFLRSLAEREAAKDNREERQRILHLRLIALGDKNVFYTPSEHEGDALSNKEAPINDEAVEMRVETRQEAAKALIELPLRALEQEVPTIADPELLKSAIEQESATRNRSSAIRLFERRLGFITQKDDEEAEG